MSLEPGRAAAIPASHREPRGRWRPGPGRPRAIPAVPGGGAIRADQIPGGVTPAGAAATPAREVRAVTDGIRDPPPPGAAAIQDPARRPAGCLPQGGSGGMGPSQGGTGGMGPPGRNSRGFRGIVPPGQHSPGACATAGPAALTCRAIPAGRGILLGRGVRGARTVGRAAGRPRSLHHRRQRGHRRHRHHGGPERAWFPARTLRGGRHGGRRAGRPAQDRLDDLPRPGALLSGGRPDKRGRIRQIRRFVQHGAGRRRGAVGRRRLLRDGARHRAGRRDHRRPLVSLAPPQADPARPGPAGRPH